MTTLNDENNSEESSSCEPSALVIDNGSDTMKVGFAGDAEPHSVFPPVVGVQPSNGLRWPSYYVGEEALSNLGVAFQRLRYPIEHGVINDWDGMEKIWHHCFYDSLHVEPNEHNVFLTRAPVGTKTTQEKMTQIMFETFSVPKAYICLQGVLSLYASGRTTGMVLSTGWGLAHAVPVYEGYNLPHAYSRLCLGGRDITKYMMNLFNERDIHLTRETARDIKETLCYVAEDYEQEIEGADSNPGLERTYELPDGSIIQIGRERFLGPEAMFQPSMVGKEGDGIHKLVYDSTQKCDVDIREAVLGNIVLSGGNTMFRGIDIRLQKDISALFTGQPFEVEVVALPERKYSTWVGGSILASLSTFQDMWITNEEYDASGPGIVHRKCW